MIPPVIQTDTDVLIIVEDGEERSLLERAMQVSPSDWRDFDPSQCQPMSLGAIATELQNLPLKEA
jgi:hypothetical protein